MRLRSLDIFRGLSSITVLAHHAGIHFANTLHVDKAFPELINLYDYFIFLLAKCADYGWFGVRLLFVLSGFCIYLTVAPKAKAPLPTFAFLRRRIFRLYPAYFAVFIFVAAFKLILNPDPGYIRHIIGHLFFWYYDFSTSPATIHTYSSVFWSLSVIVQLYIIFALAHPLIKRLGVGRVCLLSLTFGIVWHIIAISIFKTHWNLPVYLYPRFFAPAKFGEWMLGAYLAHLWYNKQHATLLNRLKLKPRHLLITSIIIFTTVVVTIESLHLHMSWRDSFNTPVSIAIFLLMYFGIMVEDQKCSQTTKSPVWLSNFIQRIGDRSYSLYLVHSAIISGFALITAKILHLNKAEMACSPIWLLIILIGVVLSFVATEFLYRFVEVPSHHFAKKFHTSKPTETTAPANTPS